MTDDINHSNERLADWQLAAELESIELRFRMAFPDGQRRFDDAIAEARRRAVPLLDYMRDQLAVQLVGG